MSAPPGLRRVGRRRAVVAAPPRMPHWHSLRSISVCEPPIALEYPEVQTSSASAAAAQVRRQAKEAATRGEGGIDCPTLAIPMEDQHVVLIIGQRLRLAHRPGVVAGNGRH